MSAVQRCLSSFILHPSSFLFRPRHEDEVAYPLVLRRERRILQREAAVPGFGLHAVHPGGTYVGIGHRVTTPRKTLYLDGCFLARRRHEPDPVGGKILPTT